MQTPVNLLIVKRTDIMQSVSMQSSKEGSPDLQQPNSVPHTVDAISYTVILQVQKDSGIKHAF